jgi:hypothetical protein
VVEGGSASGGVHDSGSVLLEHGFVGLNGDGNWLFGNGGLQLVDGSLWDGGIGLDIDMSGVFLLLAALVLGLVGVVGLEVLSVPLSVDEGVGLPSTIASSGSGVAINELLLGKGEESSGLEEMSSLDGSGGRE